MGRDWVGAGRGGGHAHTRAALYVCHARGGAWGGAWVVVTPPLRPWGPPAPPRDPRPPPQHPLSPPMLPQGPTLISTLPSRLSQRHAHGRCAQVPPFPAPAVPRPWGTGVDPLGWAPRPPACPRVRGKVLMLPLGHSPAAAPALRNPGRRLFTASCSSSSSGGQSPRPARVSRGGGRD